jgi:predicted secreted protein
MGTLKGQNFRICIYDATAAKYKVIGMATGCTVTQTNNTDDASHKDIVGAASMPTVTSKSWQVSCDSLDVADSAAILTAIKSMQPMTLMWDETATSDNQTRAKATFARKGSAYLNDVTFNFNDRENSTKSLQFQGSGPLQTVAASEATQIIPLGSYTKGQFVRLFLGSDNTAAPSTVIAAAKSLSLHVSLTLEDATTKDTVGEWQVQEPTALSYDISTGALMRSGETITSQVGAKSLADIEAIYEAGTPVKWKISNVGGDNNRTASSTIVSGSVILTQLTLNGPNRQNADYTANLNGYGEYTVAA